MRLFAQGSGATSTEATGVRRGLFAIFCLCALGLVAFLGSGAPAAQGAEACPNEELRRGPASRLPDCRAYEMVSPADMNGNGIEQVFAVRDDGQAVVYGTLNVFGGEAGSSITGKWRATRGPQGWASASLNPPTLGRNPTAYDEPVAMAFSLDLSRVLLGTRYPFDLRDQSPYFNLTNSGNPDIYLVDQDGKVDWVSHGETLPDTTTLSRALGGTSEDLSRIFFETREPLTPAAEGSTAPNLYEWREGTITSVNIDDSGTLIPGGAGVGRGKTPAAAFQAFGEFLSGNNHQGHPVDQTAVSRDGRTVSFTAPISPPSAIRQVYVRRDGTTALASLCTFGACAGEGAPNGATFLVASPDGGAVLFFSKDRLTESAPTEGGIYRFDVSSETVSFLTAMGTGTTSPGLHKGGLLAASEDLSYLYLCESGGSIAVYHEGERKTVAPALCNAPEEPALTPNAGYVFVTNAGPGKIATGEAEVASGQKRIEEGEAAMGKGETAKGESLIKSGETLVKQGERTIAEGQAFAGYENAGFSEVYLYEADTGTRRCLSCRPDGATAQADADVGKGSGFFGSRPSPITSGVTVRNLTEDGTRAFFVSEDKLAPHDVDGSLDVYEWERAGTGSCSAASPTYSGLSDGCVFLISSGDDREGSILEGVSASGDDVFFATSSSLVRADAGTEFQLYDARVGGGLAWQQASPAAGCEGEGCRGPGEAPPASSPAGSALYAGNGNIAPRRRCARARQRNRASRHRRRLSRHERRHRSLTRRCPFGRRAGR